MPKVKKDKTKKKRTVTRPVVPGDYWGDSSDQPRPSDRPVEYNLRNPVMGRTQNDGYNNGIDAPLQDPDRGY